MVRGQGDNNEKFRGHHAPLPVVMPLMGLEKKMTLTSPRCAILEAWTGLT